MVALGTSHEVQVEAYRGPLDLLLYLIKDEEVDVYDIPIARILERYLEELARMEVVDINAAADFLLMAATLMEIKSRQMLPPEEREALELDEEDPRADLVRQLLEYRRFRQAADELGEMAALRARMYGRPAFAMGLDLEEEAAADPSEELHEVEIFDLLSTFEALMKSILAEADGATIYYDDISVEERIEELVLTLRESSETVRFAQFSRRAADRADAAGIFAAILEAVRRKLVTIHQPEPLGELYVSLRGDAEDAEFAPPVEEQPGPLTDKQMVARRGAFKGFMDLDEEEDLEFAFDAEGRKAISRLEGAVDRAETAIRGFTHPQPRESREEPGPVIRHWNADGPSAEAGTATTAGAGAGASRGPGEPGGSGGRGSPYGVIVRQWTDPNRHGQIVIVGGQRRLLPQGLRFGRSIRGRCRARGRMLRSGIYECSRPRRARRARTARLIN